VCARRKA